VEEGKEGQTGGTYIIGIVLERHWSVSTYCLGRSLPSSTREGRGGRRGNVREGRGGRRGNAAEVLLFPGSSAFSHSIVCKHS